MQPNYVDLTIQWDSEIRALREKIDKVRKARNYYENQRRKLQVELDVLLEKDPRQMRLRIDDGKD